jgi:hypothetical protein
VTPEKPKNIEELKQLIDNHEIEILDVFDLCDYRRSYEEGEIYEIHI